MDKVRNAGILGTGSYVPDLCPASSRGSVQKTHRKAVWGKLKEVLYFNMGEALRIGPLTGKTYYFSIVYHGDGE